MSDVGPEGRSFKMIRPEDLLRLAALAAIDRESFFQSHRDWARQYKNRVLAVALCQGAAQHYVDGKRGIQDFDVYTFYSRHPSRPWYAKRKKTVDFEDARFGTSPDSPHFVGRRVDLLGRSLDVPLATEPSVAIRSWLRAGRGNMSAAYLAEKAVVLLEPVDRCGEIIWPVAGIVQQAVQRDGPASGGSAR